MAYLLLLVLCGLVFGAFLFHSRKKKKAPRDTYVCDLCGAKDCICHKEEHS